MPKKAKSVFEKKLISTKKIPDGERKSVQIYRSDKKSMTYDDIQHLVNGIQKNLPKPGTKLVVKAENAEKMHTLKGYNTELKTEDEWEEYYEGYAKEGGNVDKFAEFHQVQLQFIIPDDEDDDNFFV